MSNQEKAKELVNLFYQPLGTLKCGVSSDEMWEYGKKSANILVKELMKMCKYLSKNDFVDVEDLPVKDTQFLSYWREIQDEINKL